MGETQYGLPLIVDNLSEGSARGLKRVRFERGTDEGYNERWIQLLVSRHPNLLPVEQIEPALTPVIPVCMELPLPSGFVDNLYVTPDGELIVGETKLYRNPEARREVVAQIIDYAKDLSALSYEKLNEAIRKAEAADGNGGHPSASLYEIVAESVGKQELVEERFIDAISRNLERGRFLLLVIGDGIQQGTENIAAFLQQHAGMHFTFGLVELAVFELPNDMGGYLVQPRVLARTRNIDRGIVSIENGKITAKPPAAQAVPAAAIGKATTITEEKFYEELARAYPAVIPRLKEFTVRLEPLGVATEFGKGSMILRWRPDDKRAWNLGSITTAGKVWTELLNAQADSVGLLELSHAYLKRIAAAVPGANVKEHAKPTSWYVAKGGTYVTIDALLAHADAWFTAIQEFTTAASKALKDQ
ncbi:MAG TPA: hypothetical protein VHD95_06010 [Rhizomicrobium sp.]|nr:hypothetical protein [Rhizomicrobium sp.]